ncbi:unnamed protein product [Closterium sp. Yama58-4]|nr:unnamed protein product [Closterium sp. Yama58-4]
MEAYRDARVQFVMKVGELAVSPQNAEALLSLGALQLLLPLAQDSMASVRSAATLSLGRLANVSHTWSHHLVQRNVLPSLCKALTGTNRHHKRSAAYLVKAVSRHAGAELAEAGVLPLLTECLLDAMLAVRETAACALGHVAKHSGDLAMRVVETGAVRLLVTCLQDEAVARIALSVLSDVARHSLLHATAVADAGGITAAVSLLGSPDVKTRRQVCVCISTIARHSESLALQVLDQPGASRLLLCLHDSSPSLRASAAAAVREVARQGPAAAGRLVGMGGIGPLLDAVAAWRDEGEGEGVTKGSAKVSVVVALGFLAASSAEAALAVVASDGISPLQDLIVEGDADVTLKGACAWALSQMASHGPSYAKAVADSGVLIDMVTAATVHLPAPNPAAEPAAAATADGAAVTSTASEGSGPAAEARERLVRAVKDVVVRVNDIEALDALLQWTKLPDGILESVLHRMSVVLAKDNACRPTFLASNGFTHLQRLLQLAEAKRAAAAAAAAANAAAAAAAAADGANAESPGNRAAKVTRFDPASVRCIEGGVDWDLVEDHVSSINSLFPFEVSRFYSADYQQHLLQKLSDSVKPEWAAIATAAASPRAMSIKAREGRFVRGGRRPVDVEEVGRGGWEAPDLGPVVEEEGEGEEDGGEEEGGEELEGGMGEGGIGGEGDGEGDGWWGGDGDGGVQLMQVRVGRSGVERIEGGREEVGGGAREMGGGEGGEGVAGGEGRGMEDDGSSVQKHPSLLTSDGGRGAGEEKSDNAAVEVVRGTPHEAVDGGGGVVQHVGGVKNGTVVRG